MRVLCVSLVLALCVCEGALGVQVKAGDRSFPLEAVKQLKEMMVHVSPQLAQSDITAVCDDPRLPQVFRSLCQQKGAGVVFSRLVYIITPLDPCEICENPSCFGCQI